MLRAYTSVLALTLAILLAAADDSYSQHNPPRIQQPVKAPSAQATQPPTSDQRGTDQIPLTVKVIPSETAKEKADREERERRNKDEKAAVDKRLADEAQRLADETENLATYTHWLAGSALLLFCAAVGQIALFVWQLRLIGKTADAANKSIELASAESIASHPPKLAVRYIHLTSGDPKSDVENIEVGFTIENIGGSHATVTQSMIGLYIYTATLPCPPEYYRFGRKVLDGAKFSAGEVQSFTVSNNLGSDLPWYDLHFIGWAEYVDASGSIRTLRFCRRYHPETCRFIQVGDPEYEPKDNS